MMEVSRELEYLAKDNAFKKSLVEKIASKKERERGYKPLRIDERTIIIVPSDKCNEAYARYYRERVGIK